MYFLGNFPFHLFSNLWVVHSTLYLKEKWMDLFLMCLFLILVAHDVQGRKIQMIPFLIIKVSIY